MPWTPAQHRLFAAAAHDPVIARRHGLSQRKAARMASEGIKRKHRGGLSYAEGGQAEENLAVPGGAALLAGLSALAARNPMVRRLINQGALRALRPLSKPTVATESVAGLKLPEAASDARALEALKEIGEDSSSYTKGQGVWMGEHGVETNPVYMRSFRASRGPISSRRDLQEYAGHLGAKLKQEGVPITRAMRLPLDDEQIADALLTRKLKRDQVKRLGELLGSDAVVAQQPSGRALLFSLADESPSALRARAESLMDDLGLHYAVSTPGIDRMLVTGSDWGPPNLTREALGIGDPPSALRTLRSPRWRALD